MRNSDRQQRQPIGSSLSWVLSLLLFLTPLLLQAQWIMPSTSQNGDVAVMPCHQTADHMQAGKCRHCSNSSGLLTCDCCQNTVPPSLSMAHSPIVETCTHSKLRNFFHTGVLPDPPPGTLYRPPIPVLI